MSVGHIILNVLLFSTILTMFYIVSYALPKKQSLVTQLTGLLAGLSTVYIFGYLLEINTFTLEGKLFWNYVQYLSIPFLPIIWMLIAMAHLKNRLPSKKQIYLLMIMPVFVFISRFTNHFHGLFYKESELVDTPIFLAINNVPGIIFYIQIIFLLIVIIITNIIYYKAYKEVKHIAKSTTYRLFLVSLFPTLGILANVGLRTLLPIDYAAFLFPISIILIINILKGEYFLSIKPFARNEIFLNAEDAILVLDNDGKIIDYNLKAKKIFNHFDTLFNKFFSQLKHQYMHFPVMASDEDYGYFEENDVTYQVKKNTIRNSHNLRLGSLVTLTDVTENMTALKKLKANENHITYLLYHDQLTNLYNRHYLEEFLKNLSGKQHPMPLVFVDMNELKTVNDYFGHQKGDEILKALAELIVSQINHDDIAVRLGGDEFLILMPTKSEDYALNIIEKLKNESAKKQHLSIALGYAIKEHTDDFEYTYKLAEDQMYRNKNKK
ncbi:MAG: diguanylate cyclase domain-containing protein [Candidatus Izemoplasmataceae bacterium]